MANIVKTFIRDIKEGIAQRRQQYLDDRWLYEFTEIYTLRVELGLPRDEADKRFDRALHRYLHTARWDINAAWWGIDDTELSTIRAEVHTTVDKVLEQLDLYGGAWRDDVLGERPFENSEREIAVYGALLVAGRSEREKLDVIMDLRSRFRGLAFVAETKPCKECKEHR